MEKILLRPHHALCIRFFEGKGYNSDFTEHMAATIECFKEPEKCVVLVEGKDEICRKCPNYLGNGCRQQEKVQRYDKSVIQITGVSYGEGIELEKLQKLVEHRIMETGRFRDICGDCGWAAICHKNEKPERDSI